MTSSDLSQLGDYLMVRRLGASRLGETWQARKVGAAGSFVVRRLPPFLCEDRAAVDLFFEELRPLRALDHPNLARLVDYGRAGETCFVATEFVDGLSLADCLRANQAALPPPLAAELAAQACEGLAYAHGALTRWSGTARCAHGELCPENLVVDQAGLVRVLDFGLARASAALSTLRVDASRPAFRYMAPELVRGSTPEVTDRVDVYALGAVLLTLVTGRRPLEEIPDPVEFVYRLCQTGLPRATEGALPPAVRDLVAQATSADAAKRHAGATELIGALDAYLKTAAPTPQQLIGELVRFWSGRGEDPRLRRPSVIVSQELLSAAPKSA